MNLQRHKVCSNIKGTTGLAIIGAIVAGRDPQVLAQLKHFHLKATEVEIALA